MAEESWDGRKGTRIKGSRRVLLLSSSWHCTEVKQVMKPNHAACFSLPGIRTEIESPTLPPSSVWPVVLQPAGGLPLLFSICKKLLHSCGLFNTHWTPPQKRLSRDAVTHDMSNPNAVFAARLALISPEIFPGCSERQRKEKSPSMSSQSRETQAGGAWLCRS